MNKMEVLTRKLKFEPDVVAGLQEGEYAATKEGDIVTSRHIYEKISDQIVSITVDARPVRNRPDLLNDPNEAALSNFDGVWEGFELEDNGGSVGCVLSIDLGNTRTVALIVDKIDQRDMSGDAKINVYPLPMSWCVINSTDNHAGDAMGTFESVISLATSDATGTSFGGNAGRMSFVKLGRHARHNNRFMVANGGRYTLSSPKRYFWDDDPAQQNWACSKRAVNNGAETTMRGTLEGKLASAFAKSWNSNVSPARLPVSDMLGGMIAEIYEQAVHYLGSEEFKNKTGDKRHRKIVRIHVTYPSTLLPREKDLYVQKLSKGLNCYTDQFANLPNVDLISDVDEASSVLSVFAYSEIRKAGSADFWLRTIGRKFDQGFQSRIAVVDIGGGTSDLAIAQVSAYDDDVDIEPYKATISTLYRDGVNRAGDLFIYKFLNDHVKRIVINAIRTNADVGCTLSEDEVCQNYNDKLDVATSKSLTADFWFKIALQIALKCDELVRNYSELNGNLNIPENELGILEFKLDDYGIDITKFHDVLDHELQAGTVYSLKLTQALVSGFIETAELVFGDDAWNFASAISAFDSDVLVFSGKTAEFVTVQNVYLKRVALPESAVVRMKDYEIGRWCGMTDASGHLGDSKIATALGGALYLMKQYSPIGLDFFNVASSRKCIWGIVAGANITFQRPMFKDGTYDRTIPFVNGRLLIARKVPPATTATLSYEVRVKPTDLERHGGTVAGDAQIDLRCNDNDSSVVITGVHGHFQNGMEITLEQVECRVCSMNGEFAMDKVVEL